MPTGIESGWSEPSKEVDLPEMKKAKYDSPMREMTFGEKLVGLTFNPSGDDKVAKAKRLCAELADLLNDQATAQETSRHSHLIFQHAIGEILNAQMNAVKYLTLKY